MTETTEKAKQDKHLTPITVNTKYQVKIAGPKVTGLQIKQAAIAQGVPIELDFQLTEVLPHGGSKIIGDTDTVTINKNSKFVATAEDDNSGRQR